VSHLASNTTNSPADFADKERVLVPDDAREPVLLAAHHAYTVWSQQFTTGALLQEPQTEAWKEFLGMDVRMGDAYRQMGATAYQEGRFEDAAKLLATAVDFLEEDASLLGELGYSQKTVGQYERAVKVLSKATAMDGARPDLWVWLGDAQRLAGDLEAAHRSFTTARDVAPKENAENVEEFIAYTQSLMDVTPSWENFELHRDFAKRHEETGRVLRLISEYETALRVAPPVADDDTANLYKLAWVQMQLGTQYAFIKHPALAVDYFLQAIDTYARSKSDADLMRVQQNTALAYEQLADRYPQSRTAYLEKAVKHWENSLSMARSAGEPSYVRHTQGGLLATLAALRPIDDPQIVELRDALEKEIPWRGPISDFTVASAARGEIECRLREGDLGGARVLIELSDSYYQGTGFLVDLEYRAAAQAQLAGIYLEQEHYKKAGEVATVAAQQVQDLRKFVDADTFQRSMNPQTLRRATAARALAAIGEGSPELAFEAVERYQLQFAQDVLGSRVKDDASRTDFATEDTLLLEREAWFKSELEKATAARDTERMDWMQTRLDELQARLKRLALAQALPESSSISYSPLSSLSAMDTQEVLPADTTVLHLVIGTSGGAAVLVSKDSLHAVALPEAKEATIEDALLALRAAKSKSDAAAAMETLRKFLLEPLREVLPKSGTLALVGDQLASFLPLRALDPQHALVPASVLLCSSPSATAFVQTALANRGQAPKGLDLAAGTDFAAALATSTPTGALLLPVKLDLVTEDPSLGLWYPIEPTQDSFGMLTANLLALELPHALIALNLDITQGSTQLAQNHFASMAEMAWRSGTEVLVLNQWPVPADVRDTFFKAFAENLASQSPISAFQMAQDIVQAANPDSLDWAAFTYVGVP